MAITDFFECSDTGDPLADKIVFVCRQNFDTYPSEFATDKWQLVRLCRTEGCKNHHHHGLILRHGRPPLSDTATEVREQRNFFRWKWDTIKNDIMDLTELKPNFLDLPEQDQWSLIHKLRKDRRDQRSSTKTARTVRKATGGKVTKKGTVTGKALENAVDGMSKDDVLNTLEALKKQYGLG